MDNDCHPKVFLLSGRNVIHVRVLIKKRTTQSETDVIIVELLKSRFSRLGGCVPMLHFNPQLNAHIYRLSDDCSLSTNRCVLQVPPHVLGDGAVEISTSCPCIRGEGSPLPKLCFIRFYDALSDHCIFHPTEPDTIPRIVSQQNRPGSSSSRGGTMGVPVVFSARESGEPALGHHILQLAKFFLAGVSL